MSGSTYTVVDKSNRLPVAIRVERFEDDSMIATAKSANPLDEKMTPTQVVRRKFKSGLPRTIQNRELSPLEAMAETMRLFQRLRNEMEAAGLNPGDVEAGLVFYQPETAGQERLLAGTIQLPNPGAIGEFVGKVMALHKPHFLGVLFAQRDPETQKGGYNYVVFAQPFVNGVEAEARLLAARNAQLSKK